MGVHFYHITALHLTFHFFHFIIKYPGVSVHDTGTYLLSKVNLTHTAVKIRMEVDIDERGLVGGFQSLGTDNCKFLVFCIYH